MCSHEGTSLWIDAWRFFCVVCGEVQTRSDYIGKKRNEEGDVVSPMDACTVPDKSVGGPVRIFHPTVVTPPVTVYLAHGYSPETRELGLDIQAQLEEHGLRVLNPFFRPRQSVYDSYIKSGIPFPDFIVKEIVETDLAKIDISQAVVSIPSMSSIGTYMELFYAASVKNLECFVLWGHGFRRHPWLDYFTRLYINDRDGMIRDVIRWKEGVDGSRKGS